MSCMISFEHDHCPTCGAHGRLWNKEPEAFVCPRCSTFFSKFGVLLEPAEEREDGDDASDDFWT